MDVSHETPDVTTKATCYDLTNILARIVRAAGTPLGNLLSRVQAPSSRGETLHAATVFFCLNGVPRILTKQIHESPLSIPCSIP